MSRIIYQSHKNTEIQKVGNDLVINFLSPFSSVIKINGTQNILLLSIGESY